MQLELYAVLPESGLTGQYMIYAPSTQSCSTHSDLRIAIRNVLENKHHYFEPSKEGKLLLTFDSTEDLYHNYPELFI